MEWAKRNAPLRLEANRVMKRGEIEERTWLANKLWKHREDPLPLLPEEAATPLPERVRRMQGFTERVKEGYQEDAMFAKVASHPAEYPQFVERSGFLMTKNRADQEVVCIPRVKLGGGGGHLTTGGHRQCI